MGNKDTLFEAVKEFNKNQIVNFDGGYFSFAFGNEIALKLDGRDYYYILNCCSDLFEEVKREVKKNLSKRHLISFWLNKSGLFEISIYSDDFSKLFEYYLRGSY